MTRQPGLEASAARTSNAFGANETGRPFRRRRRSRTSRAKSPNCKPPRPLVIAASASLWS